MKVRFVLNTVLVSCLALVAGVSAQTAASVSGSVVDGNGAAVPGASVKLISKSTNGSREIVTGTDGSYFIAQLNPGAYSVTVNKVGFKLSRIDDFQLATGQSRELIINLETGDVSVLVDIVASETEPAAIDQTSNRLGVNISSKEVEQLPVNGRNYSQLYLNAPGVVNVGTGNFNDLRFNGRSNQQNQTKLDGVEATAIFDASPGYVTVQGSNFRLQTSLENIQEFRVDSSNYPAEYGTGTGGQINVVGKSGSNQLKGALFHYIRNSVLDARNFFDGATQSPLRLNQFGGSFGGPVIKDKVFFFGSYEGLRQRAGFNIFESTPSANVRDFVNFYTGEAGDARGIAARIALGITDTDATAALIRITNLRSTGIINAFPVGTGGAFSVGGLTNSAQLLQVNRTARLDENAYSFRVDLRINDNFSLFGRYQTNTGNLLSPDGASGRFINAKQRPDNFVVSISQVYGASVVNETKFGFNRASTDLGTVTPSLINLTGIDLAATAFRLSGTIVSPGVNGGAPTGFSEPGGLTRQSSAGNGRAQPIRPSSYSFIDTLTWTKENHTFKFGGEVRLLRVNFDQLGGTVYSFGSLRDFVLNQNLTAAFIGDLSAAGDFRIATDPITTFTRSKSGFSQGRQYYLIGFAQDEWKLKRGVTLSYGVRYEYYSPNKEADGRAIVVDAANGKILPGTSNFYKATVGNVAPRLGLTWAPKAFGGKTVIRGGGGIFFGPGQYEDLIQPIESNVFRSTQTIPGGLSTTTSQTVSSTTSVQSRFTPRVYDTNGYKVPERVGQFGLSVQQELPGSTVLTVGYVGSRGRNLFMRSVTNKILRGIAMIQNGTALPTGVGIVNRCSVAPVNGACPGTVVGVTTIREFDIVGKRFDSTSGTIVVDPAGLLTPFGEMDYKTSGGRDAYNALQIQVNRRFTQGLTLNAQYQFGRSYGNTQGSNDANTVQNPYNFNDEMGLNTFDVRHNLNVTALLELPFGKGRKYDLKGVANGILGGWQVGGVLNARSGTPINVLITRPDVVGVCQNAGGCTLGTSTVAQGFVISLPSGALPAGFVGMLNTPGGNASRATRRPNLVPGVNPIISMGGDLRYLNPAAFSMPAPGTYGNVPRNFLKGPGFRQFDLTLQKRFMIGEKRNIEFRTEIFNLFNQANFSNPPAVLPSNLGSSASSQQPGVAYSTTNTGLFGIVNGTVGRTVGLGTNRQIQMALRFNF